MFAAILRAGFAAGLVLFLFSWEMVAVFGQTTISQREMIRREIEEARQQDAAYRRLKSIGEQTARNDAAKAPLPPAIVNPSARDLQAIAIDIEDKIKYAEFLKEPRTGIIRLHDFSQCHANQLVYNVEEPCPSHITGKGSSYSFREKEYSSALLGDLSLEKSSFHARGLLTLAFLTNLGNVPLESLSLSSDGIKNMAEFQPSLNLPEVLNHRKITAKGFQVNNFIYKTSLPLKENSTYALRSIAYQGKVKAAVNGALKDSVEVKGKRLDVTIIFRVVRNHEDGSISLLWKELERKPAPKLTDTEKIKDWQAGQKK